MSEDRAVASVNISFDDIELDIRSNVDIDNRSGAEVALTEALDIIKALVEYHKRVGGYMQADDQTNLRWAKGFLERNAPP